MVLPWVYNCILQYCWPRCEKRQNPGNFHPSSPKSVFRSRFLLISTNIRVYPVPKQFKTICNQKNYGHLKFYEFLRQLWECSKPFNHNCWVSDVKMHKTSKVVPQSRPPFSNFGYGRILRTMQFLNLYNPRFQEMYTFDPVRGGGGAR